MKILLLFAIGISIIAESSFFPVPLTLIIFISIMPFIEENAGIWAFATGIILDLFIPRTLGMDSIIMLAIVYIFRRYHKKIYSGHNLFTLIIQIVIISVYTYIFYNNIDKFTFIIMLVMMILLFIGFAGLFPEKSTKKRLTL